MNNILDFNNFLNEKLLTTTKGLSQIYIEDIYVFEKISKKYDVFLVMENGVVVSYNELTPYPDDIRSGNIKDTNVMTACEYLYYMKPSDIEKIVLEYKTSDSFYVPVLIAINSHRAYDKFMRTNIPYIRMLDNSKMKQFYQIKREDFELVKDIVGVKKVKYPLSFRWLSNNSLI